MLLMLNTGRCVLQRSFLGTTFWENTSEKKHTYLSILEFQPDDEFTIFLSKEKLGKYTIDDIWHRYNDLPL